MINKPKRTVSLDPLEAVHEIQRVIQELGRTIRAMHTLGMNEGAEDLHYILTSVDDLAKDAADGICRETRERLVNTQKRTGELLSVVLENCLAVSDEDQPTKNPA